MRIGARKSTPAVKGGRVQKKNDWSLSPNYYDTPQREVVIDRKRPGAGYRHLLRQNDIRRFIEILPDWDELSIGLNAIVLAPGRRDVFGYHMPGVVHICAWEISRYEDPLWQHFYEWTYERRKTVLTRCGVPCERTGSGYLCKFTEATARAHQLLRTLLHEFGHHHDRMTSRSRIDGNRGEGYADEYARRYEELIWQRYLETFGLY